MSDFFARAPSTQWESVDVVAGWPSAAWIWHRPAHAPFSIVIRVPAATQMSAANGITLRALISAVGLDPNQISSWTMNGAIYVGSVPYLDLPLRSAIPNVDLEVVLNLPSGPAFAPPMAQVIAGSAPMTSSSPINGGTDSLFAAMDADWMAILQIERQCQALRKQLGTLHGKLQSLNRDLSTDEHRASDNADRKDWQDARRFLRDAAANISRFIREHDIGITSNAGNRLRFEQFFEQHVVPKKPFEGLAVIQQEFESYRKTTQSLMLAMQSALGSAGKDGEQRAQRILSRIAAKTRGNRTVKGT